MAKHSIIDPIDRIEGHLRIEMEVTDGYVSDAWVSGGLFRGVELIVQGREPRDASTVVQRICGVCPTSHCHTSVYAAEEAYGIVHPEGARLVRNLLEGAQFLHSHILWFYALSALDYVNPLNALNADIDATYETAKALNLSITDFGAVKERLQKFAENGQYSWLSGGWFMEGQAPEAYKLPAEVDLIATAHYIEALNMQAVADEISALMGGKMPHIMTSIPGGTTFRPTVDKMDDVLFRIKQLHTFVTDVMIPDAIAIASVYLPDLVGTAANGLNIGDNKHGNFMCYGVFDRESHNVDTRYLPSGIVRIQNGTPTLEKFDVSKITEETKHSYYAGDESPLHPTVGVTVPPEEFPGYYKDEANEVVNDKYSWAKAPRYDGQPMEVGPLSRVLVAYMSGVEGIVTNVNAVLTGLGLPIDNSSICALGSSLGRLAARPCEAEVVCGWMEEWVTELLGVMTTEQEGNVWFTQPAKTDGQGVGTWEAPRGALLHTEDIKGNKITHYQAVVPTCWNISPRDGSDVKGTIEQALIGTPVANPEAPINALRIVHGYDPCIACAIHVVEPKTGKTFEMHTSPWGGR